MGGHAWGPCCSVRRVRSGCSPAWTALSPPFSGNSPGTMMSRPSGWTLRLLGTLVLMRLPGGALSYCVDPPDIPNAVRKTNVGTLIPAGMVIKYGCQPGYKLIAGIRQGNVTCLQNSTWSSTPNFCQKIRCPAPDVNNGTQIPMPRPGEETYAFGDSVTIECDLGYGIKGSINGNAQIHCKHDGTWDPAVPVCERVCAQPPNISHGQYDDWGKRGFVVGSSVTYKCDRGFSLVGKASIQCVAGDEVTPTWSEPTPQCEETQCPVPHIQNGSLKSPLPLNYTHRTNVMFQCDPGYNLRGADRIQCQADGKWYPQLPVCDPGRCSYPPVLAYADRSHHRELLVGTVVTYSCRRGYTRIPGVSPHVTCLTNFTWSKLSELCQKVRCPAPDVNNGTPTPMPRPGEETYVFGDSVTVECDLGYGIKGSINGNAQIHCKHDGTWDPAIPVCERVCPQPPNISHGQYDDWGKRGFVVGSSVTYKCDRGFSLAGIASIQCVAGDEVTPTWSEPTPQCEETQCPVPRIQHGSLKSPLPHNYTYRTSVMFQCDPGYILWGADRIHCQDDGKWYPQLPVCDLGRCSYPPVLAYADRSDHREFPVGTVVTYSCRPGYTRIPGVSPHVTCLTNFTWSKLSELCQKVRCPAPDVNNGTPTPMPRPGEVTYVVGDSVTIECDLGYGIKGTINGNAQIHCKHDGTWDPAVPVCEPVCAQPPNISHGQYNDLGKRVFVVGSSVTYKCDRGFSLVGKASIQCVAGDEVTPTWSEPTPQCEETQCPVPRIQHGSLKSPLPHNYTYRTSVMFQCDPGYILRGADRIHCQADGKWYPQLPACDLVCAQPPNISHGQYNNWGKRGFVVGSSVTYKCDRGFSLVGKASIQCVAGDEVTPTWSEPTPQCEETQCPVPRIQHGSLKSPLPHNYAYRTSVTFQCDPGYILRGSDRIQCQADGKWYPQLPACDLGRCSYPPVLAYADRRDHREFPVGTVVTYSCRPGYTRIPGVSPHVTCLTNFTWSKISELCQKTRCPKPVVENGKQISPVETEYTYANRVVFQCDPDYILRGSEGIVCRSDGMWHPPVPFCDKTCGRPPTLMNGLHNGGMKEYFPYESQVTYTCRDSLSLIGESSIYCTSDGVNMMWSGPSPQCKVVRCPRPQVENGRMTTTRQAFTYGVTVQFSCKEGYLLHGSRVSQCQDDNTWNPPAPSCQPVQCSKPDVQNGRMVNALDEKMWYNVNESITFKCSPGYHFSDHWYLPTTDSLSITCSANGNWTALPKCQKQSNTDECAGVRESKEFLHCDVPLTELRTLLELKKLYLEIQKLKREIKKL
ncbi:complement receptor type 2-like isoform 2-T2 [Pangshura tecta]